MIIGVDVREGVRDKRAGKGEYVYQLVTHLLAYPEHTFVLFTDAALPPHWIQSHVRSVCLPRSPLLWQLLAFLYLEFVRPVDIYLSATSLTVPALVRSVPVVTTLFDFVSFLFPRGHDTKAVQLERLWMAPAIRYSTGLVAISEHTKQDAVKLFRADPKKITVTPLAPSFVAEQQPLSLDYPNIVLFVGTLEPRKNLESLVSAFNQLRADGVRASLVLAGRWGWQSEPIKQAIESSPYALDIHVFGFVPDAQKASLYQQATVLAFPSLYEGFGLPPLEAMSLGVPVVTSRVSSLPEVVGEAGLMIDPHSIDELYTALKRVLEDPELRRQLAQRGQARATQFSWEKTAADTLRALERVR